MTTTGSSAKQNGSLLSLLEFPCVNGKKRWLRHSKHQPANSIYRVKELPNDGLIRYLGAFNQERVVVCSPKTLAEVLVTNSYAFAKPYSLRWSIGRIVGVGLLLADGDVHRAQRRMLMPAFSFRHIKDLYPLFWSKGCEVTKLMTDSFNKEGETEIEISAFASRVTLDVIGIAGMGRDFGAVRDPNNDLVKTYEKLLMPSRTDIVSAFLGRFIPFKWLAQLPLERNRYIDQASNELRSLCKELIHEKRAKLNADKEQTDVDILSVALKSTDPSQDFQLEDQLMTFLAAGHETTSSSLIWAVYLLSRFPEVQRKLREEVCNNLPSVDSEVGIVAQDIDSLPYLTATCNEVLRYYAALPITSRHAAHDTTVQGQVIPKGTRLVIVPWAVNFDPQLWGPDVDEFKPERWLTDTADGEGQKTGNGGASSNFAFLTFSHGPRSCIGKDFAKSEFACLLAAWVGRFEFSLADPSLIDEKLMEIRRGITVRPKEMRVKVRVLDDH